VDAIKSKLVNARGASAENQAKIQAEIKILLDQIKDSAVGANYAGTNILATDSTTPLEIVSSYNRASDGTVTVGTISIDLTNIKLFAAGGAAGGLADDIMLIDIVTNGTDADIDGYLNDVEDALSAMSTAAADLGAAKNRLDLQKDFVSNLMDSIERGVGQLVDADMDEESTRLQALQVQQQ